MKIRILKKLVSIICALTMGTSFTVNTVGAVPPQKKLLSSNFMKRSQREVDNPNPTSDLLYEGAKTWLKRQLDEKYKESYDQYNKYRIWIKENGIDYKECECYQNLQNFVNELDRLRLVKFDFNDSGEVFTEIKTNMDSCIKEMENWKKDFEKKEKEEARQRIEQIYNKMEKAINLYKEWKNEERAKAIKYAEFHSFTQDKQWQDHVKMLEQDFVSEGFDLKALEKEFDDCLSESEELLKTIEEAFNSEKFSTKEVQSIIKKLESLMVKMEKNQEEYYRRASVQNGWISERLNSDFEFKIEEFNKQKEEYDKCCNENKVPGEPYLAYYSINQAEKQLDVIKNKLNNIYIGSDDENTLKGKGKFIDLANEAISEMKKHMKGLGEKEQAEREARKKFLLKHIAKLRTENNRLNKEKTQVKVKCGEQVSAINEGITNMKNELATFELLLREKEYGIKQKDIDALKMKIQNHEKQVLGLQEEVAKEVAKMDKQIQDNNEKMKEYQNEVKTLIDKLNRLQ